jgi:hypothetical protein
MPYAFIQDVPADENIYGQIKALLPVTAAGLVAHIAITRDGGLRYLDVWETEAAWNTFREELLEPAVEKVLAGFGIPHSHDAVTITPIDVIDVWLGGAN